jgi:hypothetical protein
MNKKFESQFIPTSIIKNKTILNNNIKDIFKEFCTSIYNKSLEKSLHLSTELIISGQFDKVLIFLINHYFTEINSACIQGVLFIRNFYQHYNSYDFRDKKQNPLVIINDQVNRNFIFFLITLILNSKHNKLLKLSKIDNEDFNMKEKKHNLISKNLNLVNQFIKNDDPKEIVIPLSEICNYLTNDSLSSRENNIIYWYSWILQFEKVYHNSNMIVASRNVENVDLKYKRDFIWIIWDIIHTYTSKHIKEYIDCLYYLFINGYTRVNKRSKSYLIILAFNLIINQQPKLPYPIPPIDEKIYNDCILSSLKNNLYYLKIFQKSAINNI